MNTRPALLTLALLTAAAALSLGDARAEEPQPTRTATTRPATQPADNSSDLVILRRATLDLAGRLPTPTEVQFFLKDSSPQPIQAAVDRLITLNLEEHPVQPNAAIPATTRPATQPGAAAETLSYSLTRLSEVYALENVNQSDRACAKCHQPVLNLVHTNLARTAEGQYRHALAELQHKRTAALVPTTYLGIGIEVPSDTIRAQLRLGDGGGLVVNYVDEAGPAKDAIKQHDVLQKFNDQLLVNAEQLVTLVRREKAGAEVQLTIIREAQTRTVNVKLGQKNVEPTRTGAATGGGNQCPHAYAAFVDTFNRPVEAAIVDAGSGKEVVAWSTVRQPVMISDGEYTATYDVNAVKPGSPTLIVVDAKGREVFRGPVGTEKQWTAVPADVRTRVYDWIDIAIQATPATQPTTKPQR